jgi:pilus assembly protein CpaB
VHTEGAAGKGKEPDSAARSFTTVTLDATPEDARRIMAAREIGKVTALLRAPGDTARSTVRIEEALALVGLGKPSGGRGAVQVLYGGRSAQQPVRPLPEPRRDEGAPVSSQAVSHTEESRAPQ